MEAWWPILPQTWQVGLILLDLPLPLDIQPLTNSLPLGLFLLPSLEEWLVFCTKFVEAVIDKFSKLFNCSSIFSNVRRVVWNSIQDMFYFSCSWTTISVYSTSNPERKYVCINQWWREQVLPPVDCLQCSSFHLDILPFWKNLSYFFIILLYTKVF